MKERRFRNYGQYKKGVRPSYLMVKVGFWGKRHAQLRRFFPWKDVQVKKGVPFYVAAHPEWMCDAGQMTWNLQIRKKIVTAMRTKTGEEISPVPGFGCLRISCGVKNTAESWKTAYSISAEAEQPVVEWRNRKGKTEIVP